MATTVHTTVMSQGTGFLAAAYKGDHRVIYQDKSLVGVERRDVFVFAADDQQFRASRGCQDPKRRFNCRQP